MTQSTAGAALPGDRAATIAEYIQALSEPQNRAEELVIGQMRRLEEEDARIQALRDDPATGTTADLFLRKDQYSFWRAAHELYYAVRTFREDSDLPPIGGRSRVG